MRKVSKKTLQCPKVTDTWRREEKTEDNKKIIIYRNSTPFSVRNDERIWSSKVETIYLDIPKRITLHTVGLLKYEDLETLRDKSLKAEARLKNRSEKYQEEYYPLLGRDRAEINPTKCPPGLGHAIKIKSDETVIKFLSLLEQIADISSIKRQLIDDLQIFKPTLENLKDDLSNLSVIENEVTKIENSLPNVLIGYGKCMLAEYLFRFVVKLAEQGKAEKTEEAYSKFYELATTVPEESDEELKGQLLVAKYMDKCGGYTPYSKKVEQAVELEFRNKLFERLYKLVHYKGTQDSNSEISEDHKKRLNGVFSALLKTECIQEEYFNDSADPTDTFENIIEKIFSEEQINDLDLEEYKKLLDGSNPAESFIQIANVYRRQNARKDDEIPKENQSDKNKDTLKEIKTENIKTNYNPSVFSNSKPPLNKEEQKEKDVGSQGRFCNVSNG